MGSGSKSSPHQMPEATLLTTQGLLHHTLGYSHGGITWNASVCVCVCVCVSLCACVYMFYVFAVLHLFAQDAEVNVRLSFGAVYLCCSLSWSVFL